jgi:hypothetical protein
MRERGGWVGLGELSHKPWLLVHMPANHPLRTSRLERI